MYREFFNVDLNIVEWGAIIVCCAINDIIHYCTQFCINAGIAGLRTTKWVQQCDCEQIGRICEKVLCLAGHVV